MRANAGILLIMGLLLLVGTVGAYIPDKITFTSNPEWVVANGVDQSTISVIITNQSNNLLLSRFNRNIHRYGFITWNHNPDECHNQFKRGSKKQF